MHHWLAIGVGGFIGANLRYYLSLWLARVASSAFPFGTIAVNGLGSFLFGLIMVYGGSAAPASQEVRLFAGTGMMGALTTFSAFSYETLQLVQAGNYTLALLNTVGNLIISFAAVWLGMVIAKGL